MPISGRPLETSFAWAWPEPGPHVGGFSGLHKGLTRVEATVKRSGGRWVATLVERSGGGGGHGGHDGADD
jgi:hypothetical protein